MKEPEGFELTIVYDGGAVVKTKVTHFKVQGGKYTWTSSEGYQILHLGVDNIIAIFSKAL